MKRIAVLGGGPAGAFAAERLATAGIDTVVFDEKLAWEKPCGGGVTHKAYQRYPFLFEGATPKQVIEDAVMAAPGAAEVAFTLRHPLVVYSRRELNAMVLERARAAGAAIEQARVLSAERHDGMWRIRTSKGETSADFCILATGARNPLRNLGTELKPGDSMMAMGYFIKKAHSRVEIQFLPGLDGYVWIFPRHDHLSVGIGGKGETSEALRTRLETYLRSKRIDFRGAKFYAHLLPALSPRGWKSNRVAGEGWMAVGDAGGLVDPITGEGIYFALRSAEIAVGLIVEDRHAPAALADTYRQTLASDFTDDLAYGANLGGRLGKHMSTAAAASVQWMRHSAAFSDIMQDLISGAQPYLDLKSRLIRELAPAGLGTLFRGGSMGLRMVGRILGHQH